MPLPPLRPDWEPTRATLQRYAQAISAIPRAGAEPDPRWAYVSLHPVRSPAGVEAFSTAPVVLGDGSQLVSTFDVLAGTIVASAGDDYLTFALLDGPSPQSIGEAVLDLSRSHGSSIAVEPERYGDSSPQDYDQDDALAWFANTAWVVSVFDDLNTQIDGELSGPHIWPHHFDAATEWFSPKVVDESSGANAQIAVGFYPEGDPYLYANPWPFDERWTETRPPHGAVWNTDGWNGLKLDASKLDGTDDRQVFLDVARFVHDLARPDLG